MGELGEARRDRRPWLPRTMLAPGREQLGIALALGLDQLAERRSLAIADAVLGEPLGEADELGLEVLRTIGEGRERL